MSHEELLRLADEVFWIIIVLTWLFGSVCGMLLMFLLAPKPRVPISDAEDWALRMKDRDSYRIDLTLADPFLDDDGQPIKLRAVK